MANQSKNLIMNPANFQEGETQSDLFFLNPMVQRVDLRVAREKMNQPIS